MEYYIKSDPLKEPVEIISNNGSRKFLKIDGIYRLPGLILIGGWISDDTPPKLYSQGNLCPVTATERFARADVNAHLGTAPEMKHGFSLAAEWDGKADIELLLERDGNTHRFPLNLPPAMNPISPETRPIIGEKLYELLTEEALYPVNSISTFKGALDQVLLWPDTESGNQVIISGWVSAPDDIEICIGDEAGANIFPIVPEFYWRPDISAKFDLYISNSRPGHGFICWLTHFNPSAEKICLYIKKYGTQIRVAEASVSPFFGFRDFLKRLFEIAIQPTQLASIYADVFDPHLSHIARSRHNAIMAGFPFTGSCNSSPEQIELSVIIPLYGNIDLLERQMRCLASEMAFRENAEVIYVIADSSLTPKFAYKIGELSERIGIPVRWTGRTADQSFASACNMGAAIAKGNYLIFMNSDVFPQTQGWVKEFTRFFEINPQAGIAGCRLIYEDGSLQHEGVELFYDDAMHIWKCRHPHSGEFVSARAQPVEVSAVTGACLAMRKSEFEAIGGWNTTYLIGGYEDIDLCMRIIKTGKKCFSIPQITMTHLESHTLSGLQAEEWFGRLSVYNATVFTKNFPKGEHK